MSTLSVSTQPRYYALRADSNVAYHNTFLSYFEAVPVRFILRQDEVDRYMLTSADTSFYTYTAIGRDGNVQPIQLSNFQIIRTEKDRMSREGVYRSVVVKQLDNGEERLIDTFTRSTWFDPSSFLTQTMVELIEKLEAAGSFRVYELVKENEALKAENTQLISKVKQLAELQP